MIHQEQTKGQEVGFRSKLDSSFFISIHKSQPYTVNNRKREDNTHLEGNIDTHLSGIKTLLSPSDPLILPFPQEWEQTDYIQRPKENFVQQQNRKKKVDSILEYHFGGGSGLRIKRNKVQPLEYHTQLPNHIRGDRTKSKGFSKKSRRNILDKLSCISQDSIPSNRVKLITLTYDGREHFERKYTPKDCKKHLNSFLTRIRKHLDGKVDKWFYMWRVEPQVKRYLRLGGFPVLHYHLTLFNVSYIDQDWVRETWSRIVCGWGEGKKPKDLVRTKTEEPRSWNNTQHYINKTLCYVSKEDVIENKYKDYIRKQRLDPRTSHNRLKFLEKMSIGRVWGIGRYDDYNHFVSRKKVKLEPKDESKLMRVLIKHYKSNLMKSKGENFSHKNWKRFEKYYRTGRIVRNYKTCVIKLDQQFNEFTTFLRGEKVEELLHLLEIPIKECVDEVKRDVLLDYTPNEYINKSRRDDKVVGL